MRSFLNGLFRHRRETHRSIIARPAHLEIIEDDRATQIPYTDILRVEVYKTDDFTVDTIWMRIDTATADIRVNEDYAGFSDAVNDLAKHLTGFRRDWYVPVTAETFAENLTVLYDASTPQT